MYRLLVGALAAVVGFSFGNAVPKWIESRGKNAAPTTQNPLVPQQTAPARRNVPRRKPFRRFKFTSTRSGRDEVTLTQAEVVVDGKPRDPKNAGRRVEKEAIYLIGRPESISGTEDETTGAVAQSCWKSRVTVAKSANVDKIEAPLLKHNAPAPAVVKASLKLQIQEWKSKLKRLKNKALANEKLWCDKYEKPALEQHFMGETVSGQRLEERDWEQESLKKPPIHETELEQDEEKARRLLQEGSRKLSLHSGKEFGRKPSEYKELIGMHQGKNKPENSLLNASVARNQRREFTFLKARRKGDPARLGVSHALVEGRKADLER